MSSFLLEKDHMRETLLFWFNLKKSAAKSHRMFVEAYVFIDSKTAILTWAIKSVKIGRGRSNWTVHYEMLKPDETVNAHRYHQQLIKLHRALREKGRIINKDMTSWFYSTTTHHRTRQKWSETTWRHSTGRCYPMPLIHQTWPLPNIDSYEDFRKWLDKWQITLCTAPLRLQSFSVPWRVANNPPRH